MDFSGAVRRNEQTIRYLYVHLNSERHPTSARTVDERASDAVWQSVQCTHRHTTQRFLMQLNSLSRHNCIPSLFARRSRSFFIFNELASVRSVSTSQERTVKTVGTYVGQAARSRRSQTEATSLENIAFDSSRVNGRNFHVGSSTDFTGTYCVSAVWRLYRRATTTHARIRNKLGSWPVSPSRGVWICRRIDVRL